MTAVSEPPHARCDLTLADVARWSSGGTPKAGTAEYYDGDIPWAVIGDLNDGIVVSTASTITEAGLSNSSAKVVQAGTLLVAMYGSIGKLGIAGVPMATNQAIACAVPNPETDTDYLFHYLKSQRGELLRAGKGGAQQNISQTVLKAWPIPLPPLDEQRRIAPWLHEVEARRASIAVRLATARAIGDRLRASVLAAACSGRLTADWRDEQRVPTSAAIDGLPATWEPTRLGDIVRIATGATPLRKNTAYYEGGTIPWITSGAVNAGIITEPTELITPLALKETNVKLFPPGTLLIAMYGEGQTRGRVAQLAIEAGTNQALAAIVFDGPSAPFKSYLRLFFENGYQRMRAASLGGVQPNLSLGMFKETLLPLPPLDEQRVIVERAATARYRRSASRCDRRRGEFAQSFIASGGASCVPRRPRPDRG